MVLDRAALLVALLAALPLACSHGPRGPEDSPLDVAMPGPVMPGEPPESKVPIGAQVLDSQRCIDRELTNRNLNQFGDPVGTTYAADAPQMALTNLSDRYRYVMRHRPDIATTCTRAPLETTW